MPKNRTEILAGPPQTLVDRAQWCVAGPLRAAAGVRSIAGDRHVEGHNGQPPSSVVSVAVLVMVTVWVWPSSESTVMV